MSAPAVHAERVSKRYRLGVGLQDYQTLRESLANAALNPLRRLSGRPAELTRRSKGDFWALRDVSFEIAQGDVVGIIGRNGAGKTTILKILSRITTPTSGWADIRGRVGSLLEVGTGFHPELTGRENLFLSGAILGMKKAEIERRFDEIVEFAEISDFLDTPIKRYSSGMKVRLAFAVAAHLEPEILIVDEVLAVGDVAFQKKCLGKMSEVTGEGRTVVFVSHNMAVVQSLCRRGIFLEHGSVVMDGPVDDAVRTYLEKLSETASLDVSERTDRRGWRQIMLTRVEISSEDAGATLVSGVPARFAFHVTGIGSRMGCRFTIFNDLGQPVTTMNSMVTGPEDRHEPTMDARFECLVDELLLLPGRYRVDVAIHGKGHLQDELEAAAFFDVEQGVLRGRPVTGGDHAGHVTFPHRWLAPQRELGDESQ
jgi:lipopolysaccharide transport system ATP-binding protein